MNIVKLQDQLKNFSQDQLVREMQAPSGNTPQFLVLGEIMRRKRMQDDFTAQNAKSDEGTVAEEAVVAAGVPQGGIADMARALAPSTDMAQNTGVQAMYAGGFVKKMAEGGGTSTAKRYAPRDERVLADAILISMANRKGMTVSEYLRAMSPKERDLVESQAANRATRDRMQALEPSTDAFSSITAVNPSYKEQLTSVFPPDPEPIREQRPDFESYGREGAPTSRERGYAARLPSFADMLTQDRAAQDQVADDKLIALANPPFPATQLPFAMPDMGQAEGIAPNPVYNAQEDRTGPQMELREVDKARAAGLESFTLPELFADYGITFSLDGTTAGPAVRGLGRSPVTAKPAAIAEAEAAPEKAAAQDKAADTKLAGLAAAKTAADEATAAADKTTPPEAPKDTPVGGGGAGGMSSYEQELMNVLQKREKAAEQDKWLALAQVGLNLMSSTQPTLGGALGEAGLKGVEAARGARDQYDKDRLELLGALEQSRMARASAAAKSAQGGASMGLSAGMGRLLTQIDSDITRLDTIVSDAALNPPTTPEGEMQLAQVQADLRSKLALKDSLLYGTAAPSEDAGGIANLSDE